MALIPAEASAARSHREARHFGWGPTAASVQETRLFLPEVGYNYFECQYQSYISEYPQDSLILAVRIVSHCRFVTRHSRLLAIGACWIFIIALDRVR